MTMPETTVVAGGGDVVNGPEDRNLDWEAVSWHRVEDEVRRLRQRIFAASQAGDHKKVRNLQKLMPTATVGPPVRAAGTALPHDPVRLQGLLEPVAWKSGTAGSEGAGTR